MFQIFIIFIELHVEFSSVFITVICRLSNFLRLDPRNYQDVLKLDLVN